MVLDFHSWYETSTSTADVAGFSRPMMPVVRRTNFANELESVTCPECGGAAYGGDLQTGTRYRGSAKCTSCGGTFSMHGAKNGMKVVVSH